MSSAIRCDDYQAIKVIEELFYAGLGSEKRRKAAAAGLIGSGRLGAETRCSILGRLLWHNYYTQRNYKRARSV